MAKGLNNNSSDYAASDYISGDYKESVVNSDEAKSLGLVLASFVEHEDVKTAKKEAITESKNYVDSSLTLIEF